MTMEANRTYVFANTQVDRTMHEKIVRERTRKISKLDTRIINFNIAALKKGDSVLIFNGSGGYGDQIMTWPFAKILSDMGAKVHILTDPGNNPCWWNLPFVKSVSIAPTLWEQVKLFNHFIVFEAVVNLDEHQDQEHPVDMMLQKVGIDPESIPAEQKSVRPVFTPGELGTMQKYTQLGKPVGIYQLASANPVRCLPANDSVFLAIKIAETFPDMHWLCLYDEFTPKEYKEVLETEAQKRGLKNIEGFACANLRELWALTEYVSVVISPDSMMAHVAGAFGTPCVGLWGPFDPAKRTAYYKNHHAIWHREFCPHSPCFVYSNTFPSYCPPRPARTVCDVLAGITPKEVTDAIQTIRR